jgi:hypothetical protein
MNRNVIFRGIALFLSVALIWYLSVKVIRSLDSKKIQKITGFTWPSGTKELQWQCSYVQGDWVKIHLQLPDAIQLNTNKFSRFDFTYYCREFNPQTMNIYRWEKQRKIWKSEKGISTFESMKRKPIISTNLLFAASKSFEEVPWEIVYDERTKQMWIYCF